VTHARSTACSRVHTMSGVRHWPSLAPIALLHLGMPYHCSPIDPHRSLHPSGDCPAWLCLSSLGHRTLSHLFGGCHRMPSICNAGTRNARQEMSLIYNPNLDPISLPPQLISSAPFWGRMSKDNNIFGIEIGIAVSAKGPAR
jgi:hypothetical protein